MQLTRQTGGGHYEIRSAEADSLKIDEETYTRSLILTPERLVPDWPVGGLDEFTRERLDELLELEPDVVLIGTGETLRFPEPWVFGRCYERGIGIEAMDTLAACRTYNVLVSEERQVVAGFILRESAFQVTSD